MKSAKAEVDAAVAPVAASITDSEELVPALPPRPAPVWLRWLEMWRSAAAQPAVLVVDALIIAAAFRHLGTTRLVGVAAGATFGLISPLLGLNAHRTSVQTQGIRWYLKPVLVVCAVMVLGVSMLQPHGLSAPLTAAALIRGVTLLIVLRVVAWYVVKAGRRRGWGLQPTLVIGTSSRVDELSAELAVCPEVGLRFAAGYTPTLPDSSAVADGHAQAFSLLDRNEIDHVLLVNDGIDEAVFREFVTWADDRRGYTLVLPLADIVRHGSRFHVGRFPVVPLPVGISRNGVIAKRAVDITLASLLLIVTAPLMALIAVAIKLKDHNPVFFRQQRVGKHGEVFRLLKFTTMFGTPEEYGEADASWADRSLGELDAPPSIDRQTSLGRLLRRWDLDELPQLFNVLKGDMSLVGPRPERVSYVERFAVAIDGYDDRHRVRPGMTGWAQINGLRGQTPLALRTAFDNDYVDHWSFGLDVRILARTVPSIVRLPPPNTERLLARRARPGEHEADHTGRRVRLS